MENRNKSLELPPLYACIELGIKYSRSFSYYLSVTNLFFFCLSLILRGISELSQINIKKHEHIEETESECECMLLNPA